MDNETIEVNGIKYRKVESRGRRAVVVVDRGWIFAGDITEANGRILIERAVWVFGWNSVGFAAVIADPKKADIRKMPKPVDLPVDAEIFRIPVDDSWGM